MSRRLLVGVILSVVQAVSGLAFGQVSAAPEQPLRIVVPYPAGGGIDYLARTIAPALGVQLGRIVIVENRPGATGMIAASQVARQFPADGNTLLLGNLAIYVINPLLADKVPYDVERDLVPVTQAGVFEFVLVVNPNVLPVKGVPDLLAYASGAQGGLSYASSGMGAVPHLLMEQFARQTGAKLVAVHYKGGVPAMQDLLSGQVGVMFLDYSTARTHIQSQKLRAIAAAGSKRIEIAPNLPTLAELGVSGVGAGGWVGFSMRAGTPDAAVKKIAAAYAHVIQSPEIRSKLIDAGFNPAAGSSAEFRSHIRSEEQYWRNLTRDRGIKYE